eukprot:jgi/Chlat1/2933/Chrsp2S04675
MPPAVASSGGMLGSLWGGYTRQLRLHPVRTQVATSALLWGIGDVFAQHLTAKDKHTDSGDGKEKVSSRGLDGRRVALTAFFGGAFVGPVGHHWYNRLDTVVQRYARPNTARFLAIKIISDSLIFGPAFIAGYFIYMGLAEGNPPRRVLEDLKRDFLPAFAVELSFWPLFQTINFRFVPVRHQLLCVNAAAILESAFLSWVKHNEGAFHELVPILRQRKALNDKST